MKKLSDLTRRDMERLEREAYTRDEKRREPEEPQAPPASKAILGLMERDDSEVPF